MKKSQFYMNNICLNICLIRLKRKGFSLIELVLVISIIAITASFVIPLLNGTQEKAYQDTVTQEMKEIQKAFGNLNRDCLLSKSNLQECVKYGLWGLFTRKHPADSNKDLEAYSPERMRGWRGKYMSFEDTVRIDPSSDGQQESTDASAVEVMVIKDPYGGYYRVLGVTPFDESKLFLVCTGLDNKLDTVSSNKDADGNIIALGDDKVIKLIP